MKNRRLLQFCAVVAALNGIVHASLSRPLFIRDVWIPHTPSGSRLLHCNLGGYSCTTFAGDEPLPADGDVDDEGGHHFEQQTARAPPHPSSVHAVPLRPGLLMSSVRTTGDLNVVPSRSVPVVSSLRAAGDVHVVQAEQVIQGKVRFRLFIHCCL